MATVSTTRCELFSAAGKQHTVIFAFQILCIENRQTYCRSSMRRWASPGLCRLRPCHNTGIRKATAVTNVAEDSWDESGDILQKYSAVGMRFSRRIYEMTPADPKCEMYFEMRGRRKNGKHLWHRLVSRTDSSIKEDLMRHQFFQREESVIKDWCNGKW